MKEKALSSGEIGEKSLDEIKTGCVKAFIEEVIDFVGKELDNGICSKENIAKFNSLYGDIVEFDKIQSTSGIAYVYVTLAAIAGSPLSGDEVKDNAITRLKESVTVGGISLPRYQCLFGVGEFPTVSLRIAKLNGKESFFAVLMR